MHLSSSAFQDGKPIPAKHAHRGVQGGENISIPLTWVDIPSETSSLALSIIDPHPVANNWIHWIVINIPKEVTSLQQGCSCRHMPHGSKELYNSFGELGYGGPQPPRGSGPHPYVVTLYALKTEKLILPENASLNAFQKALEGNILASASITGIYER